MTADDMRAPPLSRLPAEGGSLLALAWKNLRASSLPPLRADGPPVMVIPGFLATDHFTLAMRRALTAAGYRAFGWGLGVNRGVTPDLMERMQPRLESAAGTGR